MCDPAPTGKTAVVILVAFTQSYAGYQTVSLFRCARLDQLEDIDVLSEISEANRMLERRFPDCTIQRVDIGDYGQETQWVTVDLEITAQSKECMEWYSMEMARRRILILDGVRRNAFD